MILQKCIKDTSLAAAASTSAAASAATILGLKVVGGKQIYTGYYGALIEKVKKGSIADTVGHLLPGKRSMHIAHKFTYNAAFYLTGSRS